jgi:hypothetical protein
MGILGNNRVKRAMKAARAISIFKNTDLLDSLLRGEGDEGDTHLGGDDWDNRIMDWIIAEFRSDTGIDLSKHADALQRIKRRGRKGQDCALFVARVRDQSSFISAYRRRDFRQTG